MKCIRDKTMLVFSCLLLAGTQMFAQGGQGGGRRNQGPELFTSNCAGCHGGDGKGSDKAPAIATMQSVISLSDADLYKIVHDGEAGGMPAFAQLGDPGITAVVRYLRTLQGVDTSGTVSASAPPAVVTGDPANGKSLFYGKAQCSNCHMVAGEGGVLGADMTGYATTHQPAVIQRAIVNPGAPPAAAQRRRGGGGGGSAGAAPAKDVEIVTKSGQKLNGVVRSEDNLSIALLTEDGRYHFLNRGNVASETTLKTLMPTDYSTRFTPTEVNDIVAYLVTASKSAPVEPAAPPSAGRRRGGDEEN